jgi:hypothetical protein
MACYVHHVPGRLRVKIPSVKGSQVRAHQISESLYEVGGVETVTVNSVTGSVVVNYDPEETQSWRILETLRDQGYVDTYGSIAFNQGGRNSSSKAGDAIGRALFGWALGKMFEGSSLSILTAFI